MNSYDSLYAPKAESGWQTWIDLASRMRSDALSPADWEHFGKAAGPKRNMQMAKIADAVIAFWDGESRGTQSMIECAKDENIPCTVIRI